MTARRFRTPRRREPARRPRRQRCGLAPLRRESPVPSARRPRRAERSGAGAISAMAGLWLIMAPWLLRYHSSAARWNDVACGTIIALVALFQLTGPYPAKSLSWIIALTGDWLFAEAFVVEQSRFASWNDVVFGIIVVLLAIGSTELNADALSRGPARRGRR